MLQIVIISNFLIIIFSVKNGSFQSYFWGVLLGIILYFVWITIYSLKKDYLIFGTDFVESYQTNFFLQTKKLRFPIQNIQNFGTMFIKRGKTYPIYSYILFILVKEQDNSQKIILSNSEIPENKKQLLIKEIKSKRDDKDWNFVYFFPKNELSLVMRFLIKKIRDIILMPKVVWKLLF